MATREVFSSVDAGQLLSAGEHLWQLRGQFPVMALYGPMGAGKTALVKAVAHAAGVQQGASSPTFSLVNEYLAADGSLIHHFDFYRISRLEEAFDMGYEEYFYGDDLCLVEWPERVEQLLPPGTLRIYLSVNADGTRQIRLEE